MSGIVNALSVDVEEYYHALIFREGTADPKAGFPSRVEDSVARILSLFGTRGVRATFFVLGEVATAHPTMIRKIAGEGHEIACHGYRHERVSSHTPGEFRADIRRAKRVLEDLIGEAVWGYRAPNFSIGAEQGWAYDILLAEGFRYDSSLYPIRHDRYGDPSGRRFPHEIRRDGARRLIEFPIGTAGLPGTNLPVGGGGYFRLLPVVYTELGIRYANARERLPIMFYFHPWELDPAQPRPRMPWRYRLRHYVGIGREERKLSRLLRNVRFDTARAVLGLA